MDLGERYVDELQQLRMYLQYSTEIMRPRGLPKRAVSCRLCFQSFLAPKAGCRAHADRQRLTCVGRHVTQPNGATRRRDCSDASGIGKPLFCTGTKVVCCGAARVAVELLSRAALGCPQVVCFGFFLSALVCCVFFHTLCQLAIHHHAVKRSRYCSKEARTC